MHRTTARGRGAGEALRDVRRTEDFLLGGAGEALLGEGRRAGDLLEGVSKALRTPPAAAASAATAGDGEPGADRSAWPASEPPRGGESSGNGEWSRGM